MKLHLITLLLLMSSLSFGVTTNRVDRIIVLGDSNTADDTVSIFAPNGLTRVWTDLLQTYNTNLYIRNIAVSGVAAYSQQALLSQHLDYFSSGTFDVVTLMFGANDINLGLTAAKNGIATLASYAKAKADRVVIISYYGWRHAELASRTNIFLLNNLLRGYASSNGMMFIDAALILNESNSVSSKVEYEIAHEGNPMNHHLNDAAHAVLLNLITNEFVNFSSELEAGFRLLSVSGGNGSGVYTNGEQVSISANPPPTGDMFLQWIGDTQYVASVISANTTVTMSTNAVTLTATYIAAYSLQINNGGGTGSYTNGAVVAISANAVPGMLFDGWIGDTQYVNNVTYTNALVTMSTNAVTLTATYKEPTYEQTDFTYELSADNTIVITGYGGTNVNVIIPSSIGGFPVSAIGDIAFYENPFIENVYISDTVTLLGAASFYGCSSLLNITIPDSVTTIGLMAFSLCGLEKVVIGSGVTFIDNWAFAGCYDLGSIYFKGNAPTLGSGGDVQHGVFSADTFTSPDSIPATAYVKQGTTGWPPVPSTNVYEYLGRRDFYNIEQDLGDMEYGIPLEYWVESTLPKIYGVMNYSKVNGIPVENIKSLVY